MGKHISERIGETLPTPSSPIVHMHSRDARRSMATTESVFTMTMTARRMDPKRVSKEDECAAGLLTHI